MTSPLNDYDYQPPPFSSSEWTPKPATRLDTETYGMSHTMFRIKDPRQSLPFYIERLGMTLVHRSDSESGRFTNYFLVFTQGQQIPQDPKEKSRWLWSQSGVLELCHNWNTENDVNFKHCSGNEAEHKGFGHICIFVDDLHKACDRFTRLGVKFKKRPEEGTMRHIAFLLDPDGYWIEVIQKGQTGSSQGS